MALTEKEIKAIKDEAEQFYHRYVMYEWNTVSDSMGESIIASIVSAITQERIKAKKLLEALEKIAFVDMSQNPTDKMFEDRATAKEVLNSYNTKQIEP